jgi:hypothetical protein
VDCAGAGTAGGTAHAARTQTAAIRFRIDRKRFQTVIKELSGAGPMMAAGARNARMGL